MATKLEIMMSKFMPDKKKAKEKQKRLRMAMKLKRKKKSVDHMQWGDSL